MEHQTYQHQGLLVTGIDPGGIAAGFDLPGCSRLVMVNGQPMPDLFTFRMAEGDAELSLLFWQEEKGLFEHKVSKDPDEPLGLDLEIVTNEAFTHCHNGCVFCFIDQLPKGMRETLYFKDDDMRLSFLHGNYITLTNLSETELDRLIALRFSPVNVSVHTTNPVLRQKMMRNRFAGDVLTKLRRITDAGIDLNVQIVLCPDLNDGAELRRTFDDLASLNRHVRSIACVPVGLTRFREHNRLFPLRSHTPAECEALIAEVNGRQAAMLAARAERLFYLADEFYLKAGVPLPPAGEYDEFYQLENGVGMVSRFRAELDRLLKTGHAKPVNGAQAGETIIVTGLLAEPVLSAYREPLRRRFGGSVDVVGIRNRFFGDDITVAGLLTGQDIIAGLAGRAGITEARVLLPDNMLKSGTELFLDDVTVADLQDALGADVDVVPETAAGLWQALAVPSRGEML